MTHGVRSDAGALCPCGSGLEFVQCCAGREFEMAARRHDFARGELENGRPAAAVKALKQALALVPTRASAHNDLGLALKDLGRFDEAERAHCDALALDPTYALAHQNLGELLRRRGALKDARHCFERALRLNPALNQSRLDLGRVLEDLGELGPAARCYEDALERSSAPAGIYGLLGAVLWKLGDSLRALQAFERAVAGAPGSAEAHYNLGSAQLELERLDVAERSAQEALRLRPGFSEALMLRAAAVAALGMLDTAVELLQTRGGPDVTAAPIASTAQRYLLLATRLMNSRLFDSARRCLEAALREDPSEVMADHLLSALSGANPEHPKEGYVRQLFDASAATFDRDLVSKLGYDIPRVMVQALLEVGGVPEVRWNALDLGCGTGLVGEQIAPYCHRLVGVDLAPNMIARSRARGLYTDLHCAELLAALALEETKEERFDVVTAADVFIYVGKLEAVIAAIRRVLSPGGWFAFSAEAVESIPGATSAEYRLGVMGRYAHGAEYIRCLAAQNEFDIKLLRPTRIRFEHRRPVGGWLTVWRSLH